MSVFSPSPATSAAAARYTSAYMSSAYATAASNSASNKPTMPLLGSAYGRYILFL